MERRIFIGIYLIIEKIIHWCINPYWRAFLLRLLGATIGKNVRIYEVRFINLSNGFKNLFIEDDVHVGTDVMIDLAGKVIIHKGAVISPRVVLLTHFNAGDFHHNPLCRYFPSKISNIEIGSFSWVGAHSTVLAGVRIGNGSVIGACSLVNKDIPDNYVAHGVPAVAIKIIDKTINE